MTPETVSAIQLRHLFAITSGATPESDNADYWDGDIAWVTPEDVSQVDGNTLRDTRRKLTAAGYANSATKMATAGGLVLTKRAPIGQLALLGLDACSNQGCFLLSARKGVEPRFFYYVLANNVPLLQALGRGSTFMELSTDDLRALCVPLLHFAQQVRIANYLDAVVARVDELLLSKRGLLDLFAEKRRATIASAVMRGLDPKVTLRDSGVPWLGEIPAHWSKKRLRHISPAITVGVVVNPSTYVTDAGVPFLYGSDITEEGIRIDGARRLDPEVSRTELAKTCLRPGDIVTVRVGAPGVTAVVAPEFDGANCASIMLVRGAQSFDSHWLAYSMNSSVGRSQVEVVQYGAAQEQFNISHAIDFWFAVPPLEEQHAIVEHIALETAKLDAARAATERTIALLKERRAALIAATVTGQLDVGSTA